jgi:hypothetical protein
MKRPVVTDPELVIETPDILSQRVALAKASDADLTAAQAALDEALKERHEQVLDTVTDRILVDVQVLEDLIFDPKLEAASDRLKAGIEYLIAHFSITEHPTSKRPIPPGMLMSDAYRRRGPLVNVARALVDLIPTRRLLEYARDLDLVRAAREARRKAKP